MSFLFFFLEAWLRDESGRRIWGTVDSHQALGGEGACLQASLRLSLGANLRQFVSQFKKIICCWIFLFKLYFILVTSFMLVPQNAHYYKNTKPHLISLFHYAHGRQLHSIEFKLACGSAPHLICDFHKVNLPHFPSPLLHLSQWKQFLLMHRFAS